MPPPDDDDDPLQWADLGEDDPRATSPLPGVMDELRFETIPEEKVVGDVETSSDRKSSTVPGDDQTSNDNMGDNEELMMDDLSK